MRQGVRQGVRQGERGRGHRRTQCNVNGLARPTRAPQPRACPTLPLPTHLHPFVVVLVEEDEKGKHDDDEARDDAVHDLPHKRQVEAAAVVVPKAAANNARTVALHMDGRRHGVLWYGNAGWRASGEEHVLSEGRTRDACCTSLVTRLRLVCRQNAATYHVQWEQQDGTLCEQQPKKLWRRMQVRVGSTWARTSSGVAASASYSASRLHCWADVWAGRLLPPKPEGTSENRDARWPVTTHNHELGKVVPRGGLRVHVSCQYDEVKGDENDRRKHRKHDQLRVHHRGIGGDACGRGRRTANERRRRGFVGQPYRRLIPRRMRVTGKRRIMRACSGSVGTPRK